ncbi:Transcription factor Sp4 [Thelohanellus kitauei]|uniref:Transcription factor Sp4 n=1 Tax=Thelohanellus kitauei TaxID=669202 RepID=A0A0C2MWQ1_THEKT|nr:Transcription factor Sp4 [Thelohanellus kitauei]
MISENNKYHIGLFRKNVACEFRYNANDFTYDRSYRYIQEAVKYDEQLFRDTTLIKIPKLTIRFDETGELKHYKCIVDGCPKMVVRKFPLQEHYLRHCRIQPFKCNVENCDRRFTSKKQVCSHYFAHTFPRRLRCPFCDFVDMNVYNMETHVVIHTNRIENRAG